MMRIMVISTVKYAPNGIASVIRNLYANPVFAADQITFVFPHGSDAGMCRELEQLGHQVLLARNRNRDPLGYALFLRHQMRRRHIQLVHIHGNSGTCVAELLPAATAGVQCRAVHGHSAACNSPALHKLLRPILNMLTTVPLACSAEAGGFLFGNRACTVVPNGIHVESFRFDPALRSQGRRAYGLENKLVLGHVGGFTKLKNQIFLVELLARLKQQGQDAVLMLVGTGPEEARVRVRAAELHLEDSVIFTGETSNACRLLHVFDYFLFPSLSEGFGIAPVEAQANGLPVLAAADRLPESVKINENFRFVPLEAGPDLWCRELNALPPDRCPAGAENVRRAGFDAEQSASRLRQRFLSIIGE